jgi:hypothetical protein
MIMAIRLRLNTDNTHHICNVAVIYCYPHVFARVL